MTYRTHTTPGVAARGQGGYPTTAKIALDIYIWAAWSIAGCQPPACLDVWWVWWEFWHISRYPHLGVLIWSWMLLRLNVVLELHVVIPGLSPCRMYILRGHGFCLNARLKPGSSCVGNCTQGPYGPESPKDWTGIPLWVVNMTEINQCHQEDFPDLLFRVNTPKLFYHRSLDHLNLVLNVLFITLTSSKNICMMWPK